MCSKTMKEEKSWFRKIPRCTCKVPPHLQLVEDSSLKMHSPEEQGKLEEQF